MRASFTRGEATPIPVPPAHPDSVLHHPELDYDVRLGVWFLCKPYTYSDYLTTITIPADFSLDLASIPRPLWWLLASFELGLVAPLMHDFLYWCRGRPGTHAHPSRTYDRAEVDQLFYELMTLEGVSKWKRVVAYRVVRWFGAHRWRQTR